MQRTVLKMSHISKSFPGVRVLDDVTFELREGEIHALCGENGAGKSTLMKILGGVYTKDSGELEIFGEKKEFRSPSEAIEAGVGIIYQEFNLVPTLSIAENIFLGKEKYTGPGVLTRREMEKESAKVLESLGMSGIDTRKQISELSVAQQQMVEISKVLFNNSSIVVMDEPTAVLTDRETESLFEVMETLKKQGVSIIYISHRLEEVQRMCDRVTVLRDGSVISVLDNSGRDIEKDQIVRYMVGRTLENYYPAHEPVGSSETALEVRGLSHGKRFRDISFQLKKGEILGLSGLVGAGRTEVAKAIFGAYGLDSGQVFIEGQEVKIGNPRDAIRNGIVYLPEDRKKEGLILGMSIADNMTIPNAEKVSRNGVYDRKRKAAFVDRCFSSVDIHPNLPNNPAGNFSGGNQQKAIIAKWVEAAPKILMLDEPTRGIDVGAKIEIYNLILEMVKSGKSVLMISSEMMELIGLCDRVLVMSDGRLTGEFTRENMTQENIMRAATTIEE